jgi:glutathione S-transferase
VAATIKPLPAGEWTDESKAAFRKELGDEKIPKILTALETMMGEHKFLAGDDISIADLLLTGFYDW